MISSRSRLYQPLAALCFLVIFVIAAIYSTFGSADVSWSSLKNGVTTTIRKGGREQLAYMTLLTGTTVNASDPDFSHDDHFTSTRMLGYQLLHHPDTKTKQNIPFVVLVTEDVTPNRRDRLTKDGATVIPVEYLAASQSLDDAESRRKDALTKLRAWELTQYSRVLFLDGNTFLNRCLDDIFLEPTAQYQSVEAGSEHESGHDQSGVTPSIMDSKYIFAGLPATSPSHDYPPTKYDYKDPKNLSAKFFLFSPSKSIFDYYTALMADPEEGRFDPVLSERSLLNYAHRAEGKLPWQLLPLFWNIDYPSMRDIEAGVASGHEDWWSELLEVDLKRYLLRIRWKMRRFYEAYDAGLVESTRNLI